MISIIKKIIAVNLILLFFSYSEINNENNFYAQMPPTGGDFLFEESECRNNLGTGEVFCELNLDTSSSIMTQTVAPAEYYEGQGIWFQGCIIPGQEYENYDSAYIENSYVAEAGSIGIWGEKVTNFYNIDPKAKVTHILFRVCHWLIFMEIFGAVNPGNNDFLNSSSMLYPEKFSCKL